MTTLTRAAITALGAVVAALAVSGCTSSADGGSAASGTDGASAEPSPTREPTEAESVAPAGGEVIKVKGMQVNIPATWAKGRQGAIQSYGYLTTQAGTDVTLVRFPQGLVESLDELTRDNATRSDWDRKLQRQDDVTVDGQVVTHLSGMPLQGVRVDLYSTLRGGQQLELKFTFGNGESRSQRQEIIESVLATWDFIP